MPEYRSKFTHARALAKYNRPLYIGACVGIIIGVALAAIPATGPLIRLAGAFGAVIATWYATASFMAFHLMFDRSPLLSGSWIPDCLERAPDDCVQLCVSLEATTLPLSQIFPDTAYELIDIFDPELMTEPALNRAKGATGKTSSTKVRYDALPRDSATVDLTVVMLAAHEVRDPVRREKLFAELRRITRPSGSIVVVEHLRNIPAFFAFGPGFVHFYPRSEWLRVAETSGLVVRKEFDITPFAHVFVFSSNGIA